MNPSGTEMKGSLVPKIVVWFRDSTPHLSSNIGLSVQNSRKNTFSKHFKHLVHEHAIVLVWPACVDSYPCVSYHFPCEGFNFNTRFPQISKRYCSS